MATPPIFMSFGALIPNLTLKIWNSKKLTTRAIRNFWNYNVGPKKQNLRIFTKRGQIGCKWRENFNLASKFKYTIFDPFLAHKTVENWILPIFDRLWPKMGSNVVPFKFWGQIWNPPVICNLQGVSKVLQHHIFTFSFFTRNAMILLVVLHCWWREQANYLIILEHSLPQGICNSTWSDR